MRHSVVVQQHPNQRRHGSLVLYESLLADNQGMTVVVEDQAAELLELRQSLQIQQTRADVHREALAMVRGELAEQQALIADLEQGVRFYRSLMASNDQPEGLSVRSIGLIPGSADNRFQFRILVQQNALKHGLLTGTLNVDVIGAEKGSAKTYSLSSLSAELPAKDIKLRFKYFQAIDGEFEIPTGFKPRKMVAYAKAIKPRQLEVRKDFPWVVQEKIIHVGN